VAMFLLGVENGVAQPHAFGQPRFKVSAPTPPSYNNSRHWPIVPPERERGAVDLGNMYQNLWDSTHVYRCRAILLSGLIPFKVDLPYPDAYVQGPFGFWDFCANLAPALWPLILEACLQCAAQHLWCQ
jgi:hypothetical protein